MLSVYKLFGIKKAIWATGVIIIIVSAGYYLTSYESKIPDIDVEIDPGDFIGVPQTYQKYENEDLNIDFTYPGKSKIEAQPGLNTDASTPLEDWRDIIIPVGDFSLSFTRRPNTYERYERAWSNTFYSKPLDITLDNKEIEKILQKDFLNIFEVKKIVYLRDFVEFFELGEYGNDGSLIYRAITSHEDWGNIVATYVIYDTKYVWDITDEAVPQIVIDTVKKDIKSIKAGEDRDILNNINILRDIVGTVSTADINNQKK